MASKAARIGSDHITFSQRPSFIKYVFGDLPINFDAVEFVSTFAKDRKQDSTFAVGLTLALVPQRDRYLMSHPNQFILINTIGNNPRSLDVGREILHLGRQFSYNGPFPASLVAEVIVAAVAAINGEATKATDIPNIMSRLSLP
jgi:hypothetical protein